LQMRIGEPRMVPRQSTSVFKTSNFHTLLSYKQPPAGRQYYGKKFRAFVAQRNLIIRVLLLPRAAAFPYSGTSHKDQTQRLAPPSVGSLGSNLPPADQEEPCADSESKANRS